MLYKYATHPESITEKLDTTLCEQPTIHEGATVINSELGSWTEVGRNTKIVESVLDDYSYDAGHVSIIYTEIGKFTSIASYVRINPGNHPMNRVSQHHFTYRLRQFDLAEKDQNEFFDWRRSQKCTIGNDVWIGHGAVILPGVNIATGAAIGSGAVVSKDVDPYEVVVGVPAKHLKKRFSDSIIEKLLATAWWNWSREELQTRLPDFYDIDLFLEKYGS